MREQDALRVGRRAGSVTDVRVVVRTDRTVAGFERIAVFGQERIAHPLDFGHPDFIRFQRIVVEGRVIEHDDLLDGGAVGDDGADLGKLVARYQDPLCLGVTDAEDQVLSFAQVDGKRDIDGAGVERTDLGHDPHGPALGEQGDLVALFQAKGHQARTDAVGFVPSLFLGDLFPDTVHFFTEIDIAGELMRVFLDEIDDGWS